MYTRLVATEDDIVMLDIEINELLYKPVYLLPSALSKVTLRWWRHNMFFPEVE
jgi:hypothetical protein